MTMRDSSISGYPIILPEHRDAFHSEHPNWHKAWLDSIHESLKPDDWVIDVGSEQGDLSALVASWIPDGQLRLVEPQPLFWPTMRDTFEANGLKPPRDSMVGFASDGHDMMGAQQLIWRGWPPFELLADDPGFYHLNEQAAPRNRIDVFQFTNAILIDSEGSELHVLKGAERLLTTHKPLVWCAIHPEIMRDRYGHDPNELLAFMYRLGYRWDLLAFAGEIHVKFQAR